MQGQQRLAHRSSTGTGGRDYLGNIIRNNKFGFRCITAGTKGEKLVREGCLFGQRKGRAQGVKRKAEKEERQRQGVRNRTCCGTSPAAACCLLQQEQDKKPDLLPDGRCQACGRGQGAQRGARWVRSLASKGPLGWGDRAPWHHRVRACSRPDGISPTATSQPVLQFSL